MKAVSDHAAPLEPEIAQARVIVGTAAKRPVILAPALLDRQVVNAGNTHAHESVLIEFPVLVAIAAKPASAIVMPFVGETYRDAALAESPDFLDQAVVKLATPPACQERLDGGAALDKL